MDGINKTLYIPLYGKALVSRKGVILCDKKAEEIWARQQIALKRKSKSKWLAYYLGIRAAVFDAWTKEKLADDPDALVLYLGCGLDGRMERIGATSVRWFDVDFPEVIDVRKRYYQETEFYRMLGADILDGEFLDAVEGRKVIVVLEGASMYFSDDELKRVLSNITARFERVSLLMDCYTPFAAKMSKVKNPVNEVGVRKVFGVSSPKVLENGTDLLFLGEREMTPRRYIDELHGFEKFVFKHLYAGRISKKLYKLYEYKK